MQDLRHRAIRGGSAKVLAQAANFTLRVGSLMILARLLDPKDFGLVGMVTAITGVLSLFRDFGLSSATIQRVEVTEAQVSTLFWINVAVGAGLCFLLAVASPLVARFYHQPRLVWVTIALSSGFLFNAVGIQHSARLQREMRFATLSSIDVISLVVSVTTGVGMAVAGFGYWSLVAMTIVPPLVTTIGLWIATMWVPGPPKETRVSARWCDLVGWLL